MSDIPTTLKPRKSPVQARSSVTVEALHAAAIQVLIQEGITRCTTTRICERAGASVGSLYQYYPNRDALLAAVLEKHLASIAMNVERACQKQWGQPPVRMASAFVLTFLSSKLRDPEEATALYAVAEERGGSALAAAMRERIVAAVASMLTSATDGRFDDPALTATIALGALVGPIQALLKGGAPPEYSAHLEEELVMLVTAYFQARQTVGRPRGGAIIA